MRKIFMTLVALVMTVAANAQVFVGGEVGFWRNYEDNHTSFTVAPQVGYNITNKWQSAWSSTTTTTIMTD